MPSPSYASTSASLNPITPAVTHSTWTAPPLRVLDPLDPSFGYTLSSSRTRESRHDGRRVGMSSDVAPPPPYAAEAGIPLPEYSLRAPEPATLAKYLFFFGFIFPPFWIFGILTTLCPLREPPSSPDGTPAWMPEKTPEERAEIIETLRAVELKWAIRCVRALIVAVLIGVVVAIVVKHYYFNHQQPQSWIQSASISYAY